MSIATEHKHQRALSVYYDCCRVGDFQGALAAAEAAVGQSPADPLLRWYRAYARERLGLLETPLTELQGCPAPKPGAPLIELVPRLAEWPLERQPLFAATCVSASARLGLMFMGLLSSNQSLAICRRLCELNPAGKGEYLERLKRHSMALIEDVEAALNLSLRAISAKPNNPADLIRLIHLLQIYEDALRACYHAFRGDPAHEEAQVVSRVAQVAGEALGGFTSGRAPGGLMGGYIYQGLKALIQGLRAGWPMEYIGRALLNQPSRPDGASLAAYGAMRAPKDYWIELACLVYARQVLDKVFEDRPAFEIINPEPRGVNAPPQFSGGLNASAESGPDSPITLQLDPADAKFIEQIESKVQPLGFNLLGCFQKRSERAGMEGVEIAAVFISQDKTAWVSAVSAHLEKTGGVMNAFLTVFELLKLNHMVTVDSVLTNGTYITTMRHIAKMPFDFPPNVRLRKAPLRASLASMVQFHNDLSESLRHETEDADYYRPGSINDCITLETHLIRLDQEHRKKLPQFVAEHELKRIMNGSHFKTHAAKVRELIDRLAPLYERGD